MFPNNQLLTHMKKAAQTGYFFFFFETSASPGINNWPTCLWNRQYSTEYRSRADVVQIVPLVSCIHIILFGPFMIVVDFALHLKKYWA